MKDNKSSKMNLTGKIIIVTGASSGIGANAALHLSKLEASVAIVGRNVERLNTVANQIQQISASEPLAIVADVTKDYDRIVNETITKFGRLDVLVNVAGVGYESDEPLGTLEIHDKTFDTNVRAVLALTKAAIPYLEKTNGNVINVSSIGGQIALPKGLAYAMSKAALDHFTRNAAIELAPKGIRVNSVNPGITDTPLLDSYYKVDAEAKRQILEECKKTYPIGRIANVEDISNAIAFLANDSSSFITGHLLVVDGGKHLVKF